MNAIQGRDARVRDYVDRRIAANAAPGIQYVVVGRDSTLFDHAAGWADIAAQRRLQPGTTMMTYSMTKTITAAAVLQLVEQGKISLDAPVRAYLSDIPYNERLTIRHLLAQTSGIPNPMPLKWVHLPEEHPTFDERATLRKILAENAQLKFTSGEKYAYSNIAYWLLGQVIEQVTGGSYRDYVLQNVFRRLDLRTDEIEFVIPSRERHSKGYLPKWSFMNLAKSFLVDAKFIGGYEGRWLHINDNYLNGPAFGGIVSSARSVGGFLQDQLREQSVLFTPQTRRLFFEQQKTNAGDPIDMTLGWNTGVIGNVRYFYKEGGGAGFHAEMRIYSSVGIASVVIGSNTAFDVKRFLNTADREFFAR
jgi:D-alanyl-D-alanine carboxypeptidase